MKVFGLIGYPLSHSFSKKYFTEKFQKENISGCTYELFELENIQLFTKLLEDETELKGLNVTIPYKQEVIPFLDGMHPSAEKIGAVNVIKPENGKLIGYNSDYFGFKTSLEGFLEGDLSLKALILGTGGASKAVRVALEDLNIPYQYVSRTKTDTSIGYDDIDETTIKEYRLIINTTPLGMSPNVEQCPAIPYDFLTDKHYLFDLVYNPLETLFMKKGLEKGAKAINGLEMLEQQAEKAWEIWNH